MAKNNADKASTFKYTSDMIIEEMMASGGEIHRKDLLNNLIKKYPQILKKYKSPKDTLQSFIQHRSSDSDTFAEKEDIFYNKSPKGSGVWGVRELLPDPTKPGVSQSSGESRPATINDIIEAFEGSRRVVEHVMLERSAELVKSFKKNLESWACTVCGFDFREKYGELGGEFIEAHHVVPLNGYKEGRRTTIKGLKAVCSNCHRMLHRLDERDMSVKTLQKHIKDAQGDQSRGRAVPTRRLRPTKTGDG